jgi:branched-chain amino acid transport system substrate-binding protein
MKYYVRLAGLVVAALLLLGPLTAQTQQTIKIGVVAGLEIANGRDTLRGAQLAADEINAAGGVMGRKIELVVGDMKTEGDGELARRVYQDIASRSDAVVGFFRSEAVLAVLPDIPRMKKPLLITGATSLATDQVPSNYDNYKYVFRPHAQHVLAGGGHAALRRGLRGRVGQQGGLAQQQGRAGQRRPLVGGISSCR